MRRAILAGAATLAVFLAGALVGAGLEFVGLPQLDAMISGIFCTTWAAMFLALDRSHKL